MTIENLFELASREKVRFPTLRGEIALEQVWDLPLQSKTGFDLDSVAKEINSNLKACAEESFVSTKTSPLTTRLQLQLDLVKHVIATKITENEKARAAQDRKAERDRLTEILAKKQDAALEELTPEEIQKRIKELDT